jgi:hypothetical protein
METKVVCQNAAILLHNHSDRLSPLPTSVAQAIATAIISVTP